MWKVCGKAISPSWLDFKPATVLYHYDGPKTFICKDPADNIYLVHWCDEDNDVIRFIVVPFSDTLLDDLTSGEIDVREALSRPPRAWIFDLNDDWVPITAWRVNIDDLPQNVLPRPGVMLWKHLKPVISRISLRSASTNIETVPIVSSGWSWPTVDYAGKRRELVNA